MRTQLVRTERDCPTCETGTYEVDATIYPPEPGVGLFGSHVEFGRALRVGEHGSCCPLEVPVSVFGCEDALAEDVLEGADG